VRADLILSKEQQAALGVVVGEFARLDGTLDMLIGHLAGLGGPQYAVLMRGKMLGAKLEIFKEIGLLKLKSKSKKAVFTALLEELANLNGERTVAVHGLWQPKGGFTLAMLVRGFDTKESEAVHKKGKLSAQRLSDIVENLDSAHTRLFTFWRDTWLTPRIQRSLRRYPTKIL
jgi:hypothetical protein